MFPGRREDEEAERYDSGTLETIGRIYKVEIPRPSSKFELQHRLQRGMWMIHISVSDTPNVIYIALDCSNDIMCRKTRIRDLGKL